MDPLEKGMATHSSILAWRIPCTEESGGLPSMGSQRQTRLNDLTHTKKHIHRTSIFILESLTPSEELNQNYPELLS